MFNEAFCDFSTALLRIIETVAKTCPLVAEYHTPFTLKKVNKQQCAIPL